MVAATGNALLRPSRLTGDDTRDIQAMHVWLNDFFDAAVMGANVIGNVPAILARLEAVEARLDAVEADIVAIKAFVGM